MNKNIWLYSRRFYEKKSFIGEKILLFAKKNSIARRFASHFYVKTLNAKIPQLILKIDPKIQSIKGALNYIMRANENSEMKEKVTIENEKGERFTDIKIVSEKIKEWKKIIQYKEKLKGRKKGNRKFTSFIVSFQLGTSDEEIANIEKTIREFLHSYNFKTKRGYIPLSSYKFFFAIHKDQKCPHAHIVFLNYHPSKWLPKLRIGKEEIFEMRNMIAQIITEKGYPHKMTFRRDNIEHIKTNFKNSVKRRISEIKNKSTFDKRRIDKNFFLKSDQYTKRINKNSLSNKTLEEISKIEEFIKKKELEHRFEKER